MLDSHNTFQYHLANYVLMLFRQNKPSNHELLQTILFLSDYNLHLIHDLADNNANLFQRPRLETAFVSCKSHRDSSMLTHPYLLTPFTIVVCVCQYKKEINNNLTQLKPI